MGRGILLFVTWIVFVLVLVEGTSRIFLASSLPTCGSLYSCARTFLAPEPLFRFYPELLPATGAPRSRDDGVIDVLILGGSVMNRAFTPVAAIIEESLTLETRRHVRVYNLAQAGHTSRDSYLKYRRLHGLAFDLVLFYHGINEARANNAPDDVFRDDYTHYGWYREVTTADSDRWGPLLASPYVLRHLGVSISNRFASDLVPMDAPRADWLGHGATVKTGAAFRRNLEGVIETARDRGDPLLAMTFVTFVPRSYSEEKFALLQADYAVHLAPISLWGAAANVEAAVSAHNSVVRELANAGTIDYFVDQQALFPMRRAYFNDPCHFTAAGSLRFVENMTPEMLRALGAGERP